MSKIIKITADYIKFDCGTVLSSHHNQECCEEHWLDFGAINIKDCQKLKFDLTNDNFFEKVIRCGIRLIPMNGHPIFIAGYSNNNGEYSSNLSLVLSFKGETKFFDIRDCQS